MITYVNGNLFKSPAHVLVNTVNSVGVMGKGVAKEFKRLFPDMFQQYRNLSPSSGPIKSRVSSVSDEIFARRSQERPLTCDFAPLLSEPPSRRTAA